MIAIATYVITGHWSRKESRGGGWPAGLARFQDGSSIEHCLAAEIKAGAGGVLAGYIVSLHSA